MRPLAVAIAGTLLLGSASGCVSASSHRGLLEQRDDLARARSRLERQLDRLQKSNASLEAESVQIFEQLEDLLAEREKLGADLGNLRRVKERLSASLAAREMQLVAQNEEVSRLRGTYQGLVSDLEAEVAAGQIEISQLRDGLQVSVSDEILFESGSAVLNDDGQAVLSKVADQLGSSSLLIEIRGHTDNIPIRGGLANRYPSNWELAGARAAAVVRLFELSGIRGDRLTAMSRGEFEPLASNDTPEDRWRNRRIEIRLVPPPERADGVDDVGQAGIAGLAGQEELAGQADDAAPAQPVSTPPEAGRSDVPDASAQPPDGM